ncbi:glycolate oxidase subunit GlcF [Thiohalophilus sp.]|uniref:glycolate oxidase subunit GlcF n=1 Tax=Thiohalophilus sp. TaxID=3028392 RepID=UPI002ACE8342|nr:glycolate oxidase subunit GlcF [Thiohalophilus sp.]MDZ7661888.1 glycolate oxidase subunit GlcF [Thiohalophilus sp.]
MQTNLSQQYLETPQGQEANDILRACVHCGFCTATCPTYQLLGDELDGPRGRIYLIKQVLEGNAVTHKTQQHLDRCLTCRACETTCPSGVRYGRLAEIGRELVEEKVGRGKFETLQRWLLRKVVPYPKRFAPLVRAGNLFRNVMPAALRNQIPTLQTPISRPEQTHARKMLVLEGCVQSVSTPNTNAAAARVLNRLGIELISAERAGCCGAVSHHLSATEEGLDFMRSNIAAWWSHIEAGAEAIVITASGCGAMVKEYGDLLKHDPAWAEQAARVSDLTRDISEVLRDEDLSQLDNNSGYSKVAFHSPCTLQHGQQVHGVVETILQNAGFTLTAVPDAHLCCGSAGTYSILQPALSQQLLDNKLTALQGDEPDVIATANIGCQMHLASKAGKPVKHWIELLDTADQ